MVPSIQSMIQPTSVKVSFEDGIENGIVIIGEFKKKLTSQKVYNKEDKTTMFFDI